MFAVEQVRVFFLLKITEIGTISSNITLPFVSSPLTKRVYSKKRVCSAFEPFIEEPRVQEIKKGIETLSK